MRSEAPCPDHAEARGAVVVAPGDPRGREGALAVALVGVHVRREEQRQLARVSEQPADRVPEASRDMRACVPGISIASPSFRRPRRRDDRSSSDEAHVDVHAVAAELGVPLGHEGERRVLLRRDLLGGELVDHVAVGHLERAGVAQVDLVLALGWPRPC